jgi:hypothetical protein
MEGTVTTGTVVNNNIYVDVVTTFGSGTFSSWRFSAAGIKGATGASGSNGASGTPGSIGATGPTGPNMAISDTPPASPTTGQLWFESDTGLTYIYYDASWVEIGAGSSYETVINTIQAKGDLLGGTASQALGRLAVGTDNQRLIANSSTTTGLSWANDTTNTVIDAKGDLLVGATADVVAKLPVGTDNQMLVANSSATNGISWIDQPSGFRNTVINGGFDVWQRGTTAAIPSSVGTSYLADRWSAYRPAAGSTQSRVTAGLDGFQYALRIKRDNGNGTTSVIYVNQSFETSTMAKLANKTVTLSFYARAGANYSSASSLLSARVVAGTGTEANIIYTGVTGSTEPLTTTSTLTTSWQRFTVTGLIPSGTNGGGVYFFYTPTGSATTENDYFEITGVQLEVNTMATPFEQRPIGTELALCQRYYYRRSPGKAYGMMSDFGNSGGSTICYTTLQLPVTMRVVPTSIDGLNLALTDIVSNFSASISLYSDGSSQENVLVQIVSSGLTSYQTYAIRASNSTTAYIALNAEL